MQACTRGLLCSTAWPRPRRLNAIQEAIVSSAVVGAALGAACGGVASDRLGRKPVLLAADGLFALGAALMAAAPNVAMLIAGASWGNMGMIRVCA